MGEKLLYKPGGGGDFNIWMGFPGNHSFALSSPGYLWLCKMIDEMDGVNLERFCTDRQPKNAPNLVGFSFTFDNDFLTIFEMLQKNKLALKADERATLVFAGGPVVTTNPMPYVDFFDFFIIGDGEDVIEKIVEICRQGVNDKENTLKTLSELEGVFVPKYPKPVKKLTSRLEHCVYTPILSDEAFFANTFIVELSRGCANRCAFCIASYINLPLRCAPFDELMKTVEFGLKHTDKIALLGAQVSAHPRFMDILRYIDKRGAKMSISSLRVDAIEPEVVQILARAGQKSVTLAIEAGTDRLRKRINKNLTDEQILQAVQICRDNGLSGIKFYAMLGLPGETQEDIEGFLTLAKKMRNVSFGFSTFVPKPHTPFQSCNRAEVKELEDKINYLKKEFHKLGIKTSFSSPKWDYWQSVLSRGDSDLGEFLVEVYKNGGKLGAFNAAAKKYNIGSPNLTDNLPWDFIQMPPGKEFLKSEFKRLLQEAD